MIAPEMLALLGALVGSIFGAGTAWGAMRGQVSRTRNDVNGVRRIMNSHVDAERVERDRMRLAMLLLVPEAKREELIARFWPE